MAGTAGPTLGGGTAQQPEAPAAQTVHKHPPATTGAAGARSWAAQCHLPPQNPANISRCVVPANTAARTFLLPCDTAMLILTGEVYGHTYQNFKLWPIKSIHKKGQT